MQVAIFKINKKLFAISVDYLQTIIEAKDINPVPLVPPEILGLINFQGQILTVFHPGIILDQKKATFNSENVILILKLANKESEFQVGIYCDSIYDIVVINESQLRDTPVEDDSIKDYVQKTIQLQEHNIWLLNIEKMLSPERISFDHTG